MPLIGREAHWGKTAKAMRYFPVLRFTPEWAGGLPSQRNFQNWTLAAGEAVKHPDTCFLLEPLLHTLISDIDGGQAGVKP